MPDARERNAEATTKGGSAVSTPPPAIEARHVRKTYGDKVVLDGIDLQVPAGTIFSLLGPNGAGKTTMVNILATLIEADGGDVRVAGHDVSTEADAVRAAISVTGQFAAVDNLLTGEENLFMMADLYHLGRRAGRRLVAELLEKFDLVTAGKQQALHYSGGMRRRLDLAMTLVGGPRIIFLDEPTTGLDPRSRHAMWDIVRDLVADGVTVFLTTQYLDEADQLADRIAVLDGGRLVAEGSADELKRRIPVRRGRPTDHNVAAGRPRHGWPPNSACSTDLRPAAGRCPSAVDHRRPTRHRPGTDPRPGTQRPVYDQDMRGRVAPRDGRRRRPLSVY
ncbi:ATP-binding cassette domain-containing protein [Streptomyces sp. NPDC048483]|uniref:ABC transporter ATP-binding protein n=1 Tax=Streptomyces sp. NPDC048483 TaxID=3154927 RepID=UPI00341774CD